MLIIPAFDIPSLEQSIKIAEEIKPFFSTFYLSSPLIINNGAEAIKQFKTTFPSTTVIVSSNIVDYEKTNSKILFEAGADWVTVMAGAQKHVIHSLCKAAQQLNKKVLINLTDAVSIGQVSLEAKSLGADGLIIKQPESDDAQYTFFDQWDMARGNTTLPIYIFGNVTPAHIQQFLTLKPTGYIIKKRFTQAVSPKQEAALYAQF